MGDNGNSGDAVTQTSTGYFLNQMFMFISCIIMNIVMFNCGLNIHTCTWIVSVTPDFPKETKCIPICMPGSSFMHIVTYK
jgi:hypothetical protein